MVMQTLCHLCKGLSSPLSRIDDHDYFCYEIPPSTFEPPQTPTSVSQDYYSAIYPCSPSGTQYRSELRLPNHTVGLLAAHGT